jgi:ribosomal protein S18 acetylase RimI-like enzyme
MADVGVRPARRADAGAVADIQVRAWRADYRGFVPAPVLAELTGAAAREVWLRRWAEAAAAPPTPRHKLLVAVESGAVVGFAACAPATDPDHDPETTGEIITLRVDPEHSRAGHESRLLAAAADLLREDGFGTLITWLFEADEPQRALFVSAGWAPDGARRTLTFPAPGGDPAAEPAPVPMVRLHTDIGALTTLRHNPPS